VNLLRRFIASSATTGGRRRARRCLVTAWIAVAAATVSAAGAPDPQVSVRGDNGTYTVDASFGAAGPATNVIAVLTDYEQIPRFMPDVRRSNVIERVDGLTVVEQEAVAKLMMFSKRIHLILEVHERDGIIRFRDRCGKSFASYEGVWTVTERDGRTAIIYQLTAKPSFDVPEFLLKRLLKRDALKMIESLQAEMVARVRKPS
jgi:ribosome-associated toxin RatA of RatAB toxin-antitoxin module